jgi:hypothetical protein
MANLRGGNFEKQVKDAFHRLQAFNQSRYMQSDNLTHSLALASKRETYLQDFQNFLKDKGIQQGKLNTYMTSEMVKDFLSLRTSDLSAKSSLDYVTGFNSMLKGLEQQIITIPANPSKNDFLQDMRQELKTELKNQDFTKNRAVDNLSSKLEALEAKDFNVSVIAQVQSELGLRVSEAFELVSNPDKYIKDEAIQHLIGKGNHEYNLKPIQEQLVLKIQKIDNLPTYANYLQALKEVGISKSHDLRISYAKSLYKQKIVEGLNHKEAMKVTSQELNHHRAEITQYYLARA